MNSDIYKFMLNVYYSGGVGYQFGFLDTMSYVLNKHEAPESPYPEQGKVLALSEKGGSTRGYGLKPPMIS